MALLLRRQRCRWLIKNDDLGLVPDGAGDFHHLTLGRPQGGDGRCGIDGEVERLQELLG